MSKTRNNHYVPQWYQKGFLSNGINKFHYLNLSPDTKKLNDGRIITHNSMNFQPSSKCFYEKDLYTTFFGTHINDEIEQKLFGRIDDIGARAIRAFIEDNPSSWHDNFMNLFEYIDAQKLRTPKGLDWIKSHYPRLSQNELMIEMQKIRQLNITMWGESVREIVSAEESNIKFIISDNPITIYNHKCPPEDKNCLYPNDPSILLLGTQTIFPLDKNHCLILTHYDYAKNSKKDEALKRRTNAIPFRNSLMKTDEFINSRQLTDEDVVDINYIIKSRAKRFIASTKKEWLYPEKYTDKTWSELQTVLLPPQDEIHRFGGEIIVGYKDGSTRYQDRYGRTKPEETYLKKEQKKKKILPNDSCGCGSGRKYKKCCKNIDESQRPSWDVWSIRERNLAFARAIEDILGLSKDKTWDDIRRELSNEQVKKIHEIYGSLWTADTDIFSLLPKNTQKTRAVYSGFVDARVINNTILNLILYFDEVIIQNPFTNPNFIKKEFSPIDNPHRHKQQTLKNVILFLTLVPYIKLGYINLIPDISDFNTHLKQQMLTMAEERKDDMELHEKDIKLTEWFLLEELKPSLYFLSDFQKKDKFKEFSKKEVLQNPLFLLQKNAFRGEGQLNITNFSPNFEISLFLSQITGSILITNSSTRLEEIKIAQKKINGLPIYNWKILSESIKSIEHITTLSSSKVLELRFLGKGGKLRSVIQDIHFNLKDENKFLKRFKEEYIEASNSLKKEIGDIEQVCKNSKFHYFMPQGGFVNKNVQRMLITYGSDKHMSNLPLVIFIDTPM